MDGPGVQPQHHLARLTSESCINRWIGNDSRWNGFPARRLSVYLAPLERAASQGRHQMAQPTLDNVIWSGSSWSATRVEIRPNAARVRLLPLLGGRLLEHAPVRRECLRPFERRTPFLR